MDFLDYIKICQEETDQVERRRPEPPMGKPCSGQIYKVQKGDTLYSISRKYNLRVRDLMKANPFVNVYQLQIGEELCIPVLPNQNPGAGVVPYVVKREDTVLSILNENKISFQDLARLNRSAQVLKFPGGTILLLPK
jgi:LysM repeat protein